MSQTCHPLRGKSLALLHVCNINNKLLLHVSDMSTSQREIHSSTSCHRHGILSEVAITIPNIQATSNVAKWGLSSSQQLRWDRLG